MPTQVIIEQTPAICANCIHWQGEGLKKGQRGKCTASKFPSFPCFTPDGLNTLATFGCVMFANKDAGGSN